MADFLGVGLEIWAFFALIFFAIVYVISKPRKSVGVKVLWILRNRAAYIFPAHAEADGVYVDVKTARGKKAKQILQEGLPLEVKQVPKNAKAWVIGGPENGKKHKNNGDFEDEGKVFFEVSQGRLNHERLFGTIQGTGVTFDFLKGIENDGKLNPHGSLVTQEIGATGAIYDKIEEAARDTWRAIILPMAAGIGLGLSIGILVVKVLHI